MQRPARRPWYQTHFAFHLAGVLFLWAAFPPLGWWPLAWVAPWFWFALVDRNIQRTAAADKDLPARGLRKLSQHVDGQAWWASFIFWLLLLQGLRLAHWGTHFGWVALSMYLAIYLPIFLFLTRRLIERTRLPLGLAAAISWTILEWLRGHMITGFSLGLLGHTQAGQLWLIQVADFSGAYGVSFLVMLISGLVYRSGRWNSPGSQRWAPGPALWAGLLLTTAMIYGAICLKQDPTTGSTSTLNVGLVQGSIDTQFGEAAVADDQIFELYNDLTLQLRIDHPDVDLVVWPESMFSYKGPELLMDQDSRPPAESPLDAIEFKRRARDHNERFYQHTTNFARSVNQLPGKQETEKLDIHFILGINCWKLPPNESHFNSAILVSPGGSVSNRYHKMHRVMFGEYVPGGLWFPWIYRLTPLSEGLSAGEKPVAFQLKDWTLVPNICFESTVPHLIREQVQSLRSKGLHPDALVSITNDGWFWASSMLDLHLLCGVFRAVENRLPVLIAANTGISAWIDQDGRLRQLGPRRRPGQRENGVIVARLQKSGPEPSVYQWWGDWPWLLLCLGGLVAGCWPNKSRPVKIKKSSFPEENDHNDCTDKL